MGIIIVKSSIVLHRAVVGELDEDLDSEINLEDIKAEPLNAIVHW